MSTRNQMSVLIDRVLDGRATRREERQFDTGSARDPVFRSLIAARLGEYDRDTQLSITARLQHLTSFNALLGYDPDSPRVRHYELSTRIEATANASPPLSARIAGASGRHSREAPDAGLTAAGDASSGRAHGASRHPGAAGPAILRALRETMPGLRELIISPPPPPRSSATSSAETAGASGAQSGASSSTGRTHHAGASSRRTADSHEAGLDVALDRAEPAVARADAALARAASAFARSRESRDLQAAATFINALGAIRGEYPEARSVVVAATSTVAAAETPRAEQREPPDRLPPTTRRADQTGPSRAPPTRLARTAQAEIARSSAAHPRSHAPRVSDRTCPSQQPASIAARAPRANIARQATSQQDTAQARTSRSGTITQTNSPRSGPALRSGSPPDRGP